MAAARRIRGGNPRRAVRELSRARVCRSRVALVVLLGVAVGACSSSTGTSTTSAASTTTTVDAGALPQTMDQPAASSAELRSDVHALWRAVVTDDPSSAMRFFFPLAAYLQVKAIADPAADWQQRLVAAFQRDLHDLHVALGPTSTSARLLGFDVPATAQWVNPGEEHNKIGYWRVYGAVVRYRSAGRPASFTIASMISWRGRWYVVHLARIA